MWKLFDLDTQYRRHPAIRREEVQTLQRWINDQPHLPDVGEHVALLFFHACDNQLEHAKQVVDGYYTYRTHHDELFHNVDIESPQLCRAQKTFAGFVLGQRSPDGCAILLGKLLDTDTKHFDPTGALKLYFMAQDKWLLENDLINGVIFIFDLSGATFGHLRKFNIFQLKNWMYFLQELIPTRFKSLHFINHGVIMDKFMLLIKPFLKKQLKESFHGHRQLEDLYKYIPRDILPADYGGSGLHSNDLCEMFYKDFRESRMEFIEYSRKHRVNEDLRLTATRQRTKLTSFFVNNFSKIFGSNGKSEIS